MKKKLLCGIFFYLSLILTLSELATANPPHVRAPSPQIRPRAVPRSVARRQNSVNAVETARNAKDMNHLQTHFREDAARMKLNQQLQHLPESPKFGTASIKQRQSAVETADAARERRDAITRKNFKTEEIKRMGGRSNFDPAR